MLGTWGERDRVLEKERQGNKYACFTYKDCPGATISSAMAKAMALLGMPGSNV